MRKVVLICCLCWSAGLLIVQPAFSTKYTIRNLDPFDDPFNLQQSLAYSINNNGVVVGITRSQGSSGVAYGQNVGFILDAGATVIRELPEMFSATVINDAGQILGDAGDQRPYMYGYGYLPMLPIPNSTSSGTQASGMNNDGQVVGWYNAGGERRSFLWQRATDGTVQCTDIGLGTALAVNDGGQIVGQNCQGNAYLWGYGDLPGLGGEGQVPRDINNNGVVVGSAKLLQPEYPGDDRTRAVIWHTDGSVHNLGALPGRSTSLARAINNSGQVVGYSWLTDPRAVIWDPVDGIQDLGTLGGLWSVACDINDRGEIVGQAALPNGSPRAVIWTPIPTVTIAQAAGQADPTNTSPINFTVVFSEPVSDFTTEDVSITGTACATIATVTGSGKTYNVAVSGMTSEGTVIADIAAGVAHDAAGTANIESTSTDNAVTFLIRRIISANVTLKNWTAASTVTLPIQVKYRKSGTSDAPTVVALNLPVTPGGGVGTASFALPDLTPGIYDIWIKSGHWLAGKLSNIDVTAGDSTGNMLVIKNGDINGDNAVNFSDYLLLQASYKQSPVPIPSADLNGDGAVNFSDYLILQANYKKVGDAL